MGLFGPPDVKKMEARKNVKGLIKALGYRKDGAIRSAAAWALARLGDARAVEPLIAALKDGDKWERGASAGALGQIGDARAVEPLIAALEDMEDYVRRRATEALGQIGDARAVEPLIAALKDMDNPVVRTDTAEALGQIGDARGVEPLIAALKDENEWVRGASAGSLGQIGDARAVEPLIAALKDENVAVRQAAAETLDKLRWKPRKDEAGASYWAAKMQWSRCVSLGALAVEPLIAALKDENVNVRGYAAKALGTIGDNRAVEPLIVALRDGAPGHRQAAVEALGRLGDPQAMGALLALLGDESPQVRQTAVEVLDRLGWARDEGTAGAAYWIRQGQWERCVQIGAPAVEPLIAALGDRDAEVRRAAAAALDRIGWQPDESAAAAAYWADRGEWDRCVQIGAPALEPLLGMLGHSHWEMRKIVARTLVALYQSGRLEESDQMRILAERPFIVRQHEDKRLEGSSSDCNTSSMHIDTGIGVDFPV